MDYSNLFVCLMGMGTVFIGLVCIVFLVMLMSAVCRKLKKSDVEPSAAAAAPAVPQLDIGKKTELLAAITAAVAEEMGTDVSAIRIASIKKV